MTWLLDDAAPAYATHGVSSTTWNPFTINVSAGRHLFVAVTVAENPDCTITLDKPGGETNSWVKLARFQPAGGGASQHTALFAIKTTVAWNHSLQVSFSTAKVAKIANWVSFTGGSLVMRATTDSDAGSLSNDPLSGPMPIPSVGAISGFTGSVAWAGQSEGRAGDLFMAFQSSQSSTTPPTIDSDTTHGTWVDAGNSAAGAIGAGGEDIAMRMSYKIITGRGTQTLNNGVSGPLGGVILIPRETAHVITQGGDIDSTTADPAWFFRTGSGGDVLRFAMQAADLLAGGTMSKPSNSTVGTPTGYTKQLPGAIAAPAGDLAVNAFQKVAVGTEGAKVVVPITSPDGLGSGSLLRLRGGVGVESDWETPQTVFGADNDASGTNIVITATAPLDLIPGDKVLYFLAVSFHDSATSIAVALAGLTFTQYDLAFNGFITDPDGGINVGYCEIDSGSGSITPGLTANYTSGASAAAAAFMRVRYLLPPPDLPQDVECGTATSTSVQITWQPPPVGEFEPTYYEVMLDGDAPINVGLDLDHEFTGLDGNTTYLLWVRACNDSQCSEWVSVECTTCPAPPTDLTIVSSTSTTVELCWEQSQ